MNIDYNLDPGTVGIRSDQMTPEHHEIDVAMVDIKKDVQILSIKNLQSTPTSTVAVQTDVNRDGKELSTSVYEQECKSPNAPQST